MPLTPKQILKFHRLINLTETPEGKELAKTMLAREKEKQAFPVIKPPRYSEPVKVSSNNHIELNNIHRVDGVVLEYGDRILLTGQNNPRDNGIYVIHEGQNHCTSVFRKEDLDEYFFVFVKHGTYRDACWLYRDEHFVQIMSASTFR